MEKHFNDFIEAVWDLRNLIDLLNEYTKYSIIDGKDNFNISVLTEVLAEKSAGLCQFLDEFSDDVY